MLRHRSLTLALCLTALIAVSACGKKKPTAAPAPAPPPATKPENPPPPPAPPTPAAPESRVPTEEELFAKMTLDELNAKKPLAPVMFALRQRVDQRRGPRRSREESRVDEEVVVDEGDGRRSLRQPRHARIQPRARRPPRRRREGLSPQPRPGRRSRRDGQQGRRAAVLQGETTTPAGRRTASATS